MREEDVTRWREKSLCEQMANIGSEVYRTSTWLEKGNSEYSQKAFERALELIDLTLGCGLRQSALKELTRTREVLCELFTQNQDFGTLNKYFHYFALGLKR
jgi:hypothetical protein